MKKIIYVLSVSLVATFFSCGGNGEEPADLLNDFAFADSLQNQVTISEEIINELIHSIPSPIEMTSLIQSSGAEFDAQILNNTDNLDSYETAHQKAVNLGIYGADLGYLNIYEKTMLSVDYISSVRSLAKDLKVEQFFDFQTLKRLASSSKNIDSLINITTQGFSKMDAYLREQNRTKASVLIVTGTFIEGLFIATQISDKTKKPELVERIGEQKMSIDNLLLMLDVYKNDSDVGDLANEIRGLKVLYDEVKIIITYGEPVSKEVNGMLVIEDNSTSEIVMSDELLNSITNKIKDIRSKII